MLKKIIAAIIISFISVSCNPSPINTIPSESNQILPSPTEQSTSTNTPVSTKTVTSTPKPTWTPIPTSTPTRVPWKKLPKELSYGDWYFKCEITGWSYEVIEIIPGVDVTGSLFCAGYQIPVGIFDHNNNTLYYWGLTPIQNPDIVDHMGERGIERFLRVFGLGDTYLDSMNLVGKQISMAINLPNYYNRAVFDTQNIGQFATDYWKTQETVDRFASTGVLPGDNNILYPISLGVIK